MTPTPAQPVPPEPPPPDATPVLPTERWRFARWLIATGRLSEWPDAPYTQGVARAHAESSESSAGPAGVQR